MPAIIIIPVVVVALANPFDDLPEICANPVTVAAAKGARTRAQI